MRSVEVAGLAVEPSTGAPVVVLREVDDPHRLLPIFIGPPEAAAIALAAAGPGRPGPLTHDLMAELVEVLDARVDAVEVTDLTDGAFRARLDLEGPGGSQHLDARPSDAIALAVRVGAPMFVSEAVLDEAGTIPAPEPGPEAGPPPLDDETIDAAVDEFRSFLDEVSPAQFDAGG